MTGIPKGLRAMEPEHGLQPAWCRRTVAIAALTMAGLAAAPTLPAAAADGSAAEASERLFADMSARDLPGVLSLIPADGFTEISPNSNGVQRLDAKAFEGLFKSGLAIDLHITGLQVQALGNAAVVTGVRVGSITPPGTKPVEERQLATLIWSKVGDQWTLQHIHLSAAPAGR